MSRVTFESKTAHDVTRRTNVHLLRNSLAQKRQVGDAFDSVLGEQAKRSRTHGPEHGSGADLLNRATREMSPSAPNLIGSADRFGVFHMARGVDPGTPIGAHQILAALGAASGAQQTPVLTRHLGKMRVGDNVVAAVWIDMMAYGEAMRRNSSLLEHFFPAGVLVFASAVRRSSEMVSEARPVHDLNRVTVENVRNARAQSDILLLDFADFSAVWNPFGVCVYAKTVLDSSDMFGKADALLSVTVDGVVEIPFWWADWIAPVAIGYDVGFVYVARTLGLEEEERRLTLEGKYDEWLQLYEDQKRLRQEAGVVRDAAVQRIRETNERRMLSESMHGQALALMTSDATATATATPQLPCFYNELIRYARWEPYVSADGLPPPASFLNTVSPDGVKHRGGYVPVMRVTHWNDKFAEHKSQIALVRQLMYGGAAFDPIKINSSIKAMPKVKGLVYSAPPSLL